MILSTSPGQVTFNTRSALSWAGSFVGVRNFDTSAAVQDRDGRSIPGLR